jgi:1-acyl-sn-glycerol-3-phosphate acyltransferase
MYRLMELGGQEYVDVYAAKIKADAEAAVQQAAAATSGAHVRGAGPAGSAEGRGPGTVTRLPGTKAG